MTLPRIVLDTNVFIAGIISSGKPSLLLAAWKRRKFQLLLSQEILDEFMKVMQELEIPPHLIKSWRIVLKRDATFVEPKEKLEIVKADAADNRFLEVALEGKADFVVSGDKHLLRIKEIKETKIVAVATFFRFLLAKEESTT